MDDAVLRSLLALRDPRTDVRWRAAEALGDLGDSRAIQPLIELVRNEPEWHV
jgi:HEAT repeat protein